MTTQVRNNEMVNLLRADFQARYEPNFALASIYSCYMHMPGLRGFWNFASVNESGNLPDLSGQGRTLTNTNAPVFNNYNLASYANFNGINQAFTRADEAGLDFIGNEAYLTASLRGLTVTAWIRVTAYSGSFDGIVTKYTSASVLNSNFFLGTSGSNILFGTYSGAAGGTGATRALTAGTWAFVCGRFDPSTVVSIKINDGETINAVGAAATLNNSTQPLYVGYAPGFNYFNGNITLVALYSAYLTDAMVNTLYQQSRPLFNV